MAAIFVVYFVQGALGLASLATTYFFKDELHLAPAEVAALSGLFTLPWVFKPLYGFLTDSLPIFGYRRCMHQPPELGFDSLGDCVGLRRIRTCKLLQVSEEKCVCI